MDCVLPYLAMHSRLCLPAVVPRGLGIFCEVLKRKFFLIHCAAIPERPQANSIIETVEMVVILELLLAVAVHIALPRRRRCTALALDLLISERAGCEARLNVEQLSRIRSCVPAVTTRTDLIKPTGKGESHESSNWIESRWWLQQLLFTLSP
jgi:hypothetical protein